MKEWENFLSHLEQQLGAAPVDKWIRPLKVARFDAANLYLEAPDPMAASWFEEHVRHRLKNSFINSNFRPIRVHLETKENQLAKPASSPSPLPIINFYPDSLDPSAIREQFILQSGNVMAYKLLFESPSILFNPIYLYGAHGSGKTHLLMAAATHFTQQGVRARYVHTQTFTDHVVAAIRAGQMHRFRNAYRDIDLLLVDDVDQLAAKNATQEEFFHTFNTLHTAGKQIILASHLPPFKLKEIEPRLVSRFEWGISTPLTSVSMKEIIEKKANLWHFELSSALQDFLCTHFSSDPITALQALVIRTQTTTVVTPEMAAELLADIKKSELPTPEALIKTVSAHFGIASEDLIGKAQSREFAQPRQVAMYLFRHFLKWPFQAIGKYFGRDHSTVMSSVKLIEKGIEAKDPDLIEAIGRATQKS